MLQLTRPPSSGTLVAVRELKLNHYIGVTILLTLLYIYTPIMVTEPKFLNSNSVMQGLLGTLFQCGHPFPAILNFPTLPNIKYSPWYIIYWACVGSNIRGSGLINFLDNHQCRLHRHLVWRHCWIKCETSPY